MHTSFPECSRTPLNDEQYRLFRQFVSTLEPEQAVWVGGYLTALTSRQAPSSGSANTGDITILVGSQTGNSEALAEQARELAMSRGLKAVIKKMGDYKLPQLKTEKNLLIIVSTYG